MKKILPRFTTTDASQRKPSGPLAFSAILFLLVLPFGCKPIISLGKNPSGADLALIERQQNYRGGQFQNLASTPAPVAATARRRGGWTRLFKYFLEKKPDGAVPASPLPTVLTNLKELKGDKPLIVWFGHSTFLVKTKTATILFDPNFSDFAGPFPGLVNSFPGTNHYSIKDLPPIDLLVVSHDHYDHLDYTSVKELRKKVKRVIVPLGVGSHFRFWGYDPAVVTELNWDQQVQTQAGLRITSTPAHHRSNRTMAQRKTLWSSYVVEADGYKFFFSGDTGYSEHFALIGKKYGPFDLALMECGQYNPNWSHSHMFPWQTARAAQDIGAKMIIPMHWGRFAESTHPWQEPVERLLKSADSLEINVTIPYIGEAYPIGERWTLDPWWRRIN